MVHAHASAGRCPHAGSVHRPHALHLQLQLHLHGRLLLLLLQLLLLLLLQLHGLHLSHGVAARPNDVRVSHHGVHHGAVSHH
jgi:hypothetical protein